ncbi:hypothetical protein ACFFWD_22740 [Bradyrhizobium erythrophlei]|uniref:hypothetical protein n=1 Tax=Bradyrhizobium erythrophlei TaxID=1437360 RepID=UPI0035E8454F
MPNFHEDLHREDLPKGPSNRKFGLTFAAIGAALAAIGLYRGWRLTYLYAALTPLFLILALRFPDALSRLNKAWLTLGLWLNRIVSPIVMLALFYLVIVPCGLAIRLFKKDLLQLRKAPAAQTYWLSRTDQRHPSESMRQQF